MNARTLLTRKGRFNCCYILIIFVSLSNVTLAQNDRALDINEVEVTADNLRYEIEVDALDTANIIGAEQIQRMAASDIFSVLENTPGLTIDGGLTTSGKSFAIRGFDDNEDVLVQIDGVTQNFEKYRSGTGVEIEPELLKEIAVFRGGSNVSIGAGYQGGAVLMETKDARDFLKEGRYFGSILRAGYNTNNYGKLHSITSYGLPLDGWDLLVNAVKRDTNDFERPNGRRFPNSSEQQESLLAKSEYYNENIIVSYSYRDSFDEGLEPFDLQSRSAMFPNVFRRTEEQAHSFRTQWNPDSDAIKLDINYGIIDKQVKEQPSELNYFVSSFDNELRYFQYDIWTATVKNELLAEGPFFDLKMVFGWQGGEEARFSERERSGVRTEYDFQPSGTKATDGRFIQLYLEKNDWRIGLGLRQDYFEVSADDKSVASFMQERFGSEKASFDERVHTFTVDKKLGNVTLFYRYNQTFGAPLVTEYFTTGSINQCANFSEVRSALSYIQLSQNLGININSIAEPYDNYLSNFFNIDIPDSIWENLPSGVLAATVISQYTRPYAQTDPYLQANYFCGPIYKNEKSVTQDSGFHVDIGNWLDWENELTFKLTFYEIMTDNDIGSIRDDPITGQIEQPGKEYKQGYEGELKFQSAQWLLEANFSIINGYRQDEDYHGNVFRGPLQRPPGDSLNLTASHHFNNIDLELGLRWRFVKARLVDQNPGISTSLFSADFKRVSGYTHGSFFSRWAPTEAFNLRFSVENITNKAYQLRGFGGDANVNNVAPGRDYRFTAEYTF